MMPRPAEFGEAGPRHYPDAMANAMRFDMENILLAFMAAWLLLAFLAVTLIWLGKRPDVKFLDTFGFPVRYGLMWWTRKPDLYFKSGALPFVRVLNLGVALWGLLLAGIVLAALAVRQM